jgi:hypothetical protein
MAVIATSDEEVDAVKFQAFLNGAYQAGREAYLDGWHRFLMFAVIMLGTSSVADVLTKSGKTWAAIATAALAALDLVLDFSVRARTAAFLRKSFFEIAACLDDGALTVAKADAALLRLAAEEEPPYMAAHALAENWATRAIYGESKPLPCRIVWWRKLARHVMRQGGHNFSADVPTIVQRLRMWILSRRPAQRS